MIELRAGSATDVGLVRTQQPGRAAGGRPPVRGGRRHGRRRRRRGGARPPPSSASGRPSPTAASPPPTTCARPPRRPTGPSGTRPRPTRRCGAWAPPWWPWPWSSDGRLATINVGDSRLYVLHDGELRPDHLRPQPGGRAGGRGPAVAGGGRVPPEAQHHHPGPGRRPRGAGRPVLLEAEAGDRFLLCSDGLLREVTTTRSPPSCAGWRPRGGGPELVDEAKRRGGNDNITVVVVDVVDPAVDKDDSPTTTRHPGASPSRPTSGRPGAAPAPTPPAPAARPPHHPPGRAVFVGSASAPRALAAVRRWPGTPAAGYFVGLRGDQIIIFQGRPGGVLWFQPTVADATTRDDRQIESRPHLPTWQPARRSRALTAARQYVTTWWPNEQAAQAGGRRPPAPRRPTPHRHDRAPAATDHPDHDVSAVRIAPAPPGGGPSWA